MIPDVDSIDCRTCIRWTRRVSKALNYKNYTANIDFDIFNLFNTATTLGKQYDVDASNFNKVLEIVNPRILRIGFRVSFK